MTPQHWQQIEKLFNSALERELSQRAAFLGEACRGDETLRREVESLLAMHEQTGGFLEALPAEVAAELLAEDKAEKMVGRMLGRYRILSLLGAGGMGEVYGALDTRLDREVAVKILPLHLVASPEALLRFEREAKAVAALSHPNILAIHDFGTEQGLSYAVMELLKGETLRTRLSHSRLPWRKAVGIGVEIAEGLSAAHAKGITHRDLKPENIFLTSAGQTKILDFGLARVKPEVPAEALSSMPTAPLLTGPGAVMGTIGYMSPEQLRGEVAYPSSDIFSFGCVLYEMLTGQRAFACETAAETNAAILRDDPPELADTGKNIPVELGRVISHCLEKNPPERFQSACDLAFALRTLSSGSANTQPLVKAKSKMLPARTMGALAAGILLVGLLAYLFLGPEKNLSLVILPFDKGGTDPETEYIADGITEGLINSFTQLRQLRVTARATAFSYKGRAMDPKKIGGELGVRVALTGKAALRGDALSVQADLVDVATGSQIWGNRYNLKRSDLLAVQEKIIREVFENLKLRPTGEQQQRLSKRHTQNDEAYDLYIKGRFHLEMRTPDGIKKGMDYLQQAIAKDSNFAQAYAGLADAYIVEETSLRPAEAMPKAKEAATTALQIDNTLAEAHTSLAAVKMLYDWDWQGAESEFKQALELNPSYPTAHHWHAQNLTALARHDEAITEIKRAQALDPRSLIINRDVGWQYYYAGLFDQAIEQARNTLDLEPKFTLAHTLLGRAYVKKGMFQDAITEMQKAIDSSQSSNSNNRALLGYAYAASGKKSAAQQILDTLPELSQQQYIAPRFIAAIYGELGDKDQAFAWLEKAYEDRSGSLILLKVDPMMDSLRSDQRFRNLTQRIGLPN
jgi:eukaryotic-like serine/threonine-protein kinase